MTDTIETDGYSKAFVEFDDYIAGSTTGYHEYKVEALSRWQTGGTYYEWNDWANQPTAFEKGNALVFDKRKPGMLNTLPPRLAFRFNGPGSGDARFKIKVTLIK